MRVGFQRGDISCLAVYGYQGKNETNLKERFGSYGTESFPREGASSSGRKCRKESWKRTSGLLISFLNFLWLTFAAWFWILMQLTTKFITTMTQSLVSTSFCISF